MPRRYPDSQKNADERYESKFKSLRLRLDFDCHDKLLKIAELTNTSISAIIRTAIENEIATLLKKHGIDSKVNDTAQDNQN